MTWTLKLLALLPAYFGYRTLASLKLLDSRPRFEGPGVLSYNGRSGSLLQLAGGCLVSRGCDALNVENIILRNLSGTGFGVSLF